MHAVSITHPIGTNNRTTCWIAFRFQDTIMEPKQHKQATEPIVPRGNHQLLANIIPRRVNRTQFGFEIDYK